jgi:hypothetical protein
MKSQLPGRINNGLSELIWFGCFGHQMRNEISVSTMPHQNGVLKYEASIPICQRESSYDSV